MFYLPHSTPPRPLVVAFSIAGLLLSFVIAPATSAQTQAPLQSPAPSSGAQGPQDDWQFTLSAGTLVMPNYPGDDEYLVAPFPNIEVRYKDIVTASVQGVEVNALRFKGFTIGPVARIDFGRDEDGAMPFAVVGGDTDELEGLGNISITAELGGFVRYQTGPFRLSAEVRQGVNGHESMVGNLAATYNTRVGTGPKAAFVSIGPSLTFADDDYNEVFFGISPEQSAASGLAQFEAEGGLNSVGLDLFVVKPLSRRWSIVAFANYDRLTGDPADSPLVQERGSENQFMAGVFVGFAF